MPQGAGDEGGERQSSPWTSDTPPTFALPPHDRVPSASIPDAAYGESQAQEATPEMTPEKTPEKKKSQKSGQ